MYHANHLCHLAVPVARQPPLKSVEAHHLFVFLALVFQRPHHRQAQVYLPVLAPF